MRFLVKINFLVGVIDQFCQNIRTHIVCERLSSCLLLGSCHPWPCHWYALSSPYKASILNSSFSATTLEEHCWLLVTVPYSWFLTSKKIILRCQKCLVWRIIFFSTKVILFIFTGSLLGFASTYFEKCPSFLQLHFSVSTGQGLLEFGSLPDLVHILFVLLAIKYWLDFRNVFWYCTQLLHSH